MIGRVSATGSIPAEPPLLDGLALPDPGEPRFCARCANPLQPRPSGGRERPWCPVCGWTYYAKPALGAAILAEDEGRILLVQRKHEPYQDWWMLPAGFVEYGEDAMQTAAREAMEETGLLVEVKDCLGIFSHNGDPRGSSHLAVFRAQKLGGTLTPGDDASDARWFAPDQIPDKIAFQAHRDAIASWLGPGRAERAASLLEYLSAGPASPVLIYVVIENPKGTVHRMVYDAERAEFVPSGEIFADPLPIHYGWIPATWSAGDGRELDVVVVGEGKTVVGSVVPARPIGTLLREDQDHKVLAVRVDIASSYADVVDAAERPELRDMVDGLFRHRAVLKGWASAAETRRLILEAQRARILRGDHVTPPSAPVGERGG